MLGENAHAANQNITRSAHGMFNCPSAIAVSHFKMSENAGCVNSPLARVHWTKVSLTGIAASKGTCDLGISSGSGNVDDFLLVTS